MRTIAVVFIALIPFIPFIAAAAAMKAVGQSFDAALTKAEKAAEARKGQGA